MGVIVGKRQTPLGQCIPPQPMLLGAEDDQIRGRGGCASKSGGRASGSWEGSQDQGDGGIAASWPMDQQGHGSARSSVACIGEQAEQQQQLQERQEQQQERNHAHHGQGCLIWLLVRPFGDRYMASCRVTDGVPMQSHHKFHPQIFADNCLLNTLSWRLPQA